MLMKYEFISAVWKILSSTTYDTMNIKQIHSTWKNKFYYSYNIKGSLNLQTLETYDFTDTLGNFLNFTTNVTVY